jgi:lipopolysaccharide transport system permease protein
LWDGREVLLVLALRDLRVRYKQTLLGALWALGPPLALVAAFSLSLGRAVHVNTEGNYPLFVLTGVLPWALFASTVSAASQSLVANPNLLTRVAVPPMLLPLAASVAPLADGLLGFGLLAGILLARGAVPGWSALLVPLLLAGLLAAAHGVGFFLAALMVRYRDVRHGLHHALQLALFLTPAIYLPPARHARLFLNPLNGLIAGTRAALLGQPLDGAGVCSGLALAVALLVLGGWYFRSVEHEFADVI